MSNFVVYKSSAGSGKTFTLVKEYLRLALYDEKKITHNFKRILALTFTNKAASEMKLRVIESLNTIVNLESLSDMGHMLKEELKISEEELKKRAAELLSSILHNYSDFSIGTIDSFTHKIVKTFAHDLSLPVNFTIETDIEGFYNEVVSELLNKIGEDDFITKLLTEYSLSQTEDNSSWDPENSINDFLKLLQKENADNYLFRLNKFSSEDLNKFRKEFNEYISYYTVTLREKAKDALTLIEQNQLSIDDFYYGKASAVNFFKKCYQNALKADDHVQPRISDAVANNKWTKTAHKINTSLTEIATELIAFVNDNQRYFSLCHLLKKQIYQLMLIKQIEEISNQKKSEEQIVFISEFNNKIFELINNEPAPFIYERLGEKYQHYLLDEFQDTSGMQWQNILPLLDNSLAGGWFNLVVGDGKQSIYRWRNANVKQFANLPHVANSGDSDIVKERIEALKRNFVEKRLNVNYRSVRTIIEFNNELFAALSSKLLQDSYSEIYKGQAQEIKKDSPGYITVQCGQMEGEELESFHCAQVKNHIQSALDSGFSYRDICIISRKNKKGSLIAAYLMEEGIPVVSSDSLLLNNNLEVNTVVSFLNYLGNNADMVSAAAVMNYLAQSGKISGTQLNESLKKLAGGSTLFQMLKAVGIEVRKEDFLLRNLLDNCIHIVGLLGLNETNHLYIRFFLDEVNEYLVSKNSNLTQFSQWWENRRKNASVIIQQNSDAVKIMTIHSSKGLEFPVVIVPFCNWEQYNQNDAWVELKEDKLKLPVAVVNLSEKVRSAGLGEVLDIEKQEQHLDNLNLLYVAFTRAGQRLHIISKSGETDRRKLISAWIEEFMIAKYGRQPELHYEIGEKQNAIPSKEKAHSQYLLKALQFDVNSNNIQIKPSFLKDTDQSSEAKKQGIVIHWILSKIKTKHDVKTALSDALNQGFITSAELDFLHEKINRLIQLPLLEKYFEIGTNFKIESDLITSAGEIMRPDRVVFLENTVVIIDYKTGEEHDKKYFQQLTQYENALKEMGHLSTKKILVYIDSEKVLAF
jgi:ATP-dependent exoDNAse (exonuclease V) beta subunit